MRHRYVNDLEFPRHGEKIKMILDLSANPDDLWKGFDGLRGRLRLRVRITSRVLPPAAGRRWKLQIPPMYTRGRRSDRGSKDRPVSNP